MWFDKHPTINECAFLVCKATPVLVKTDGKTPRKSLVRAKLHLRRARYVRTKARVAYHTHECIKALTRAGIDTGWEC